MRNIFESLLTNKNARYFETYKLSRKGCPYLLSYSNNIEINEFIDWIIFIKPITRTNPIIIYN